MNEPSSFETNELKPWNWNFPDDQEKYPYFSLKCPTNRYDNPPYRTSKLNRKTIYAYMKNLILNLKKCYCLESVFVFDNEDLLAKKARLSTKTLCMIHKHNMNGKDYLHYDVHSLYGHSQSVATYE